MLEIKPKLFVSHSKTDRLMADVIVEIIETLGIPCWYAVRDSQGGQETDEPIEQAISNCPAFLFIYSNSSEQSNWPKAEAARAISEDKEIYVFSLDDSSPPLQLENKPRHKLNLSDDKETVKRIISNTFRNTEIKPKNIDSRNVVVKKDKSAQDLLDSKNSNRTSIEYKNDFKSYIDEVDKLWTKLEETLINPNSLTPLIDFLWDLIVRGNKQHAGDFSEFYTTHPSYYRYRKTFFEAQATFEGNNELNLLRRVIKQNPKDFSYNKLKEYTNDDFNRFAFELIEQEYIFVQGVAIDLHVDDTAVFVGCGSLSHTLLQMYYDKPELKFIGVDNDRTAIGAARSLVEKFGLKNITYRFSNGEDYNYDNASIVYVSSMVRNKKLVLNQIAATAPVGTYVVCRAPKLFCRLLYEEAEYRENELLELIRTQDWRDSISKGVLQTLVLRVGN